MSDLPAAPAADPSPLTGSGFASPTEVPSHLDAAALARALEAGRPTGTWSLLDVDGVRCPRVQAGAGPELLCVHGLGHDAWDWAQLFVRCTMVARLTAYDLPGFGLSTKPARRWDLGLLVRSLLAAARALPTPPVVVASSLGGHVALLAALHEPALFSHLLLGAPGGLVEVPAPMQAMLRAYYSVDAIAQRSEAEIVGNSRRIFASPGLLVDDALAARKLAVRRSSEARAFALPFAGVVDDVFHHVVLERLSSLRVPCTFVVGERDVVVPPDAVAAAARQHHARFVALPGVGHCPHLEVPDRFAELVRDVLVQGGRHVSG
ncbi:MAG: alpha/beta hydrolase [Deltaproteobacteria bacterium]|nr:alpha/beta hydrolase [Deltaproteobacteria bacterium]